MLYLLACAVFLGLLLLIRPAPASLRDPLPTVGDNLTLIPGSLASVYVILSVFFMTSDYSFLDVNEKLYAQFALSNSLGSPFFKPHQFLTHSFMHADLLHVLANAAGLAMLSVYERRVGTGRFLAVLVIGVLVSTPSVFLVNAPLAGSGISGGVYALAAAYFLDEPDLSFLDWGKLFLYFLAIVALTSGGVSTGSAALEQGDYSIDYLGHALGAIGGIVYCAMRPRSLSTSATPRTAA
jgi:membrane associated rhomboid family serine protease